MLIGIWFALMTGLLATFLGVFHKYAFNRVTYENAEIIEVRYFAISKFALYFYGAVVTMAAALFQVGLPQLNYVWGWAIPISLLVVILVAEIDISATKAIFLIASIGIFALAVFGLYQTEWGENALRYVVNQIRSINAAASTEMLLVTGMVYYTIFVISIIHGVLFKRYCLNTKNDTTLTEIVFLKGSNQQQLYKSSMGIALEDILELLLGCLTFSYTLNNVEHKHRILFGYWLKKAFTESIAKANRG